jgi:hypothetical protein
VTIPATANSDTVGSVELFYDKDNSPGYSVEKDIANAARRWFWDWEQSFLDVLKDKGIVPQSVQIIRDMKKEKPPWKPENCCGNKETCCGGALDGH